MTSRDERKLQTQEEAGMASATGRGSAGNVVAAICSFFIPGLGQLVQGRVLAALFWFVLAWIVWFVTFGLFGWVVHVIACVEAARWRP
jgi:TM2 domain-containing membrane protein YozV